VIAASYENNRELIGMMKPGGFIRSLKKESYTELLERQRQRQAEKEHSKKKKYAILKAHALVGIL
jgi:hypothetical protein